ncbi:specifically androgen-regulated gene protein-like isoform X1 [Oncorhynchus keta]|uniref:specifically androgen-regulated gene protein-like isoform X1 n=2 Tax=Oncorhynchus keta TaxID=8018 RepID=UPI0015FD13C2|nr:specifically androgen-regulated gene protein-like isoform X1 [Oncorhynchus keta]XP_035594521.1 specifically androgen-regulated gene protein-like isoform X1 [Oncorhynchus keta]
MAKSDTWPGGVAMESLINMDSAGSYDSVVSMNSGFSDDSLEYLSVEERACLMFLESTIESLEMEEDSGLSNDEPDPSSLAAEHDHLSMGQTSLEDVSKLQHDDSGRDRKSYLNCRVPTPLLLANGLASIQLKVTGATTHPSTPTAAIELKAPLVATQPSTPGAVTDLKPQKVITEPTVPEVVTDPKAPKIATVPKTSELSSDIKAPGLATITKVPVLSTEFKTSKTTPSLATSDLPTDDSVDNMPKGVSVDSKPAKCNTKVPSELDLKLIPPPSDFRDDELEEKSDPPVPAELRGPLTYNELEQLRRQVSMKRAAPASPGAQDAPPSKPCVDLPVSAQALPSPSDVLPTPIPEALEPKSRPAVAPKPKRLPSNIILKSHKLDSHPSPSPIDRSMIDPQKVRREALRKLGLLKTEDGDSGPVVSSKSRKSWASPPSHSLVTTQTKAPAKIPTPAPVPAITLTPVPAITLTPVPAPALTPALVPAPVSATIPAPPTTPAPVPAQFSDNAKTLPSPATLPSPPKHIPPPIGVKSATLERSGKGLSSYVASNASLRANQGPKVALSPGNLRNSRPRPASLGTGKDFVNVQGEASHPQPVHGESHNKLPRSHGISVLICPNSKSGEDRREALKKLGLLGD